MKAIKYSLVLMFLLSTFAVQAAAPQVNNVRIVEDMLWLAAFIILAMFSFIMTSMTKGGMKGIYYGYLTLFISAILGMVWKGIGVISRVAVISKPEWLFGITREVAEGFTGLVFGIAFVILFLTLTKK